MVRNKILITGGHPTPAIACIDYMRVSGKQIEILFLGRRFANEKEPNDTFEYQEISHSRRIPFVNSVARRGLAGVVNIFSSIIQATKILQAEKPSHILSFGGYISVPVCIASIITGIPFYIHEQTAKPGSANRFMSLFAKKVFISFPDSAPEFFVFPWQKSKIIFTGNPIRSEAFEKSSVVPKFLSGISGPLIFVNGGNLGSHAINEHIFKLIPDLLQVANVVHQVGNLSQYGDWEKAQLQSKMHEGKPYRYIPLQYLPTSEYFDVLRRANCVVGRSGANSFFELIATCKPAVIVPLPYSARGEQESHAKILNRAGVAEIFSQYENSSELARKIRMILDSESLRSKSFEKLSNFLNPNSASIIFEYLTH